MSNKVAISPDTSIINRIRLAGHMNWPKVLAELIDNAFDAGATSVSLDFERPNRLVVADNGQGCKNLLDMVIYGARRDHDTTASGMYGVGSKDACIWIASRVTIASIHESVRRQLMVDWDTVLRSHEWLTDEPEQEPTDGAPGTRIVLDGFQRQAPSKWDDLERSLAATFASAIRSGKSIMIRRPNGKQYRQVEPPQPPELADVVELTLDVGRGGRQARVKMGILQLPAQQTLQGMTIAMYGGRVLRGRTRVGLGSDPTPGLYGFAEIFPRKAWKIFPNKDGVDDRQERELNDAIASHTLLASLIAKAKARGHDIHLDRINGVLEAMSEEIGSRKNRKARRSPPSNPTGAISPTGTGSPHGRAARTQEGRTFGEDSAHGRKLTISVLAYGDEGPLFDVNGDNVHVNSQHAFYGHTGGDMRVIAPLAVSYYTMYRILDGQRPIPFPEEVEGQHGELSRQVAAIMECLARAERRATEVANVPA